MLDEYLLIFSGYKLVGTRPFDVPTYNSRYLNIDLVNYDLLNINDIKNLPFPKAKQPESLPDVTHSLDYILRMIAGNLEKVNLECSIALYRKVLELMYFSSIHWNHEDYLQVIKKFYKYGFIEEAEFYENQVDEKIIFGHTVKSRKPLTAKMMEIAIKTAEDLNTDLIEVRTTSIRSREACIYGTRIYSISGNHLLLKKLPKVFPADDVVFNPIILGLQKFYDENSKEIKKPILHSIRPLVDTRSIKERKAYQQLQDEYRKPREFYLEYKQYFYLKWKHPSVCPRSQYAFQKMKRERIDEFNNLLDYIPDSYKI